MLVKDLAPNPNNPRLASNDDVERLGARMGAFGDLGGIVFNRKTKSLVTAHQRVKTFPPTAKITIVKKYAKPTKTGTIAEGFIEHDGEKWRYREVSWSKQTEKAAALAANNHAGKWDEDQLGEWLGELEGDGFDLKLTGFDDDELDAFMDDGGEDPAPKKPKKEKGKSSIVHECPNCGHEFN